MIRKKHLKAALAAANASIEELGRSNNKLWLEREELRRSNVELSDAVNEALRENSDLRLKLRSASDLFGTAFVKGGQLPPATGPSRPNRKKLTRQEVKDIRDAYFGGAKQQDLADNYGVNPATISRLVRGIYH